MRNHITIGDRVGSSFFGPRSSWIVLSEPHVREASSECMCCDPVIIISFIGLDESTGKVVRLFEEQNTIFLK